MSTQKYYLNEFFSLPKTHVYIDGLENDCNFTLKKFSYLDLCNVVLDFERHDVKES